MIRFSNVLPKAGAIAAAMRVVGIAGNFVMLVIFARATSIADFGGLSALWAGAMLISVPAARGGDQLGVRQVAIVRDNQVLARATATHLVRRGLVGSAVASAVVLLGAIVFRSWTAQFGWTLVLGALSIIPLMMVRVIEGCLRGYGATIGALVATNVVLPGAASAVGLVWVLTAGDMSLLEAMGVRTGASCVAAAVAVALLLRKGQSSPGAGRGGRLRLVDRTFGGVGTSLMFVSTMTVLLAQADVIAVAALGGVEAAGLYNAAARVALSLNLALVAVNFALSPAVARFYARGQHEQLQSAVTRASRQSSFIAGSMALVLLAIPTRILDLFGAEYSAASPALRVLVLGYFVSAFVGPVGTVLNMTDGQGVAAKIMIGAVAIDILLLVLLVPRHGALGGAIATAVAVAGWNVAMAVAARVLLGVTATPLRSIRSTHN